MSEVIDNLVVGDNGEVYFTPTYLWNGEKFIARDNYYLESVLLKLGRYVGDGHSGDTGNLYLSIRIEGQATALAIASLNTLTMPNDQSESGSWFAFILSNPVTLVQGAAYIVALNLIGWTDMFSGIFWKWSSYNPATRLIYQSVKSQNGVIWANQGVIGACFMFANYGTSYVPRNPARPDADLIPFPDTRPDDYNPDDFWLPGEWDGDTYTPPEWGQPGDSKYFATGGGRWGQQLVAVGHGLIYYEELT